MQLFVLYDTILYVACVYPPILVALYSSVLPPLYLSDSPLTYLKMTYCVAVVWWMGEWASVCSVQFIIGNTPFPEKGILCAEKVHHFSNHH